MSGSEPEPQARADEEGFARPQMVIVKTCGVQRVAPGGRRAWIRTASRMKPSASDPSTKNVRFQRPPPCEVKSVIVPVHFATGVP